MLHLNHADHIFEFSWTQAPRNLLSLEARVCYSAKKFRRPSFPLLLYNMIVNSGTHMKRDTGKLHVLTDTALQSRFSHVELAQMAIEGGASVIQLRQKNGTTREMISIASQMKRLCCEGNVLFIVNDRIDVAIASEADGVHLGQDDFPLTLARKLLGDDKIIGGSAGNLDEALICFIGGADYVGVGPVFATSSKMDAGPAGGLDILRTIAEQIPLPVIAIGGVDEKNAADMMGAGARGIAVISSVCCTTDPKASAAALAGILQPF